MKNEILYKEVLDLGKANLDLISKQQHPKPKPKIRKPLLLLLDPKLLNHQATALNPRNPLLANPGPKHPTSHAFNLQPSNPRPQSSSIKPSTTQETPPDPISLAP